MLGTTDTQTVRNTAETDKQTDRFKQKRIYKIKHKPVDQAVIKLPLKF